MSKIELTKQTIKKDFYSLQRERRKLGISRNKQTSSKYDSKIKTDKFLFDLCDDLEEINVLDDDTLSLKDECNYNQWIICFK